MSTWQSGIEPVVGGRRIVLRQDGAPLTFDDALRGWRGDAAFRAAFNALLADAPYAAFRWELPPLTATTLARPLEFVLLDAPELLRNADAGAFAEHFRGAQPAPVACFANLGGDAMLVAPLPQTAPDNYSHLAAFVRGAPEAQRHALWAAVAEAMQARLGERPLWLSTAGDGVAWLHVRLDERPKYYRYVPYRRAA